MDRLILININQLVTCKGKAPKKGAAMNDAGIVSNGCVVIESGRIVAAGSVPEVFSKFKDSDCEILDCSRNAVIPGFVDSHTHFIFAGSRPDEFAMRMAGSTYMDIMDAGGGIVSTVSKTRLAGLEELTTQGMKRADSMITFGVTTVEGKSGYGLDRDSEIKQLKAMKDVNERHFIDVVPTFLGAHTVPGEFTGRSNDYLEYLLKEVLPVVKKNNLAEFVDIFCEKGVFEIEQSEYYLGEARKMGFGLKLHADEIVSLGGAELAARLGAVSADHLLKVSNEGIRAMAEMGVISTLLPTTAFCLKEEYADARGIIDSGGAVALATDFNPGSSFTNSIPLVMALAAIEMNMSVEEIIIALTINGACAVNRQNEIGSIEAGKKADILILECPSINYLPYNTGINLVQKVIKDGKVVYDKYEKHEYR
ncbi:MAG: imidazolonepropionase [Clostridia bacterium]|nr:imidazolonepropionase [Clostridia bacterium]